MCDELTWHQQNIPRTSVLALGNKVVLQAVCSVSYSKPAHAVFKKEFEECKYHVSGLQYQVQGQYNLIRRKSAL